MADQNRTALDWEDVRVFIALARYGSLSAAARALAVNHATVARRLQALEQAMGNRLVERRPDGYVLTPAGTRALAAASDMELAAAVLARGGADDRPTGLVRINAPPSVAQGFLITQLADLVARHEGLDLDVATDFRAVSLERREADIALRYARPQDGDLMAKPLVTVGFGFYGTSAWRDRIAAGQDPTFVGFDELNGHLPEAAWLSRQFPRARMSIRTTSQVAQAIAARAGGGVALLPHFVGRLEPSLHLLLLEPAPPSRDLWLVTRRQDRKELSIATVVDFLTRLFAERKSLFEAQPPA